jgi:hypothetical protein
LWDGKAAERISGLLLDAIRKKNAELPGAN